MNRKTAAIFVSAAMLFCGRPSTAQHGGGGHGFGGHGSMGHSGSGGGSGTGHSVGRSFGRIFGHRSGASARGSSALKAKDEGPPLAGAAMIHGKVVQLSNPEAVPGFGRRLRRAPLREFAFQRQRHRFGFGANSSFGFCGGFSGFPSRRPFFEADFGCFQRGFFFDPFFLAGFDSLTFGDWGGGAPFVAPDLMGSGDENQPPSASGDEDAARPDSEAVKERQADKAPETLLQLTNGTMYGLTAYWPEGDRLHYVTSYGGENSVPLAQIDFGETVKLNAERGVRFELLLQPLPKADN